MSIRKRLAVGAAAATLALVLGATVLSPVVAGAQESTTTTTTDESTGPDGPVRTEPANRLRDSLEDLVTDGTITAAQADAVAEHLAQSAPGPGHRFNGRDHIGISFDIAAATIGIERSALMDALGDGQTIAEVAAANGTDAVAVIDALVAANQAKLDELVADGSITAEEAAERAAAAVGRVTDWVNAGIESRPDFGPDFRPDFRPDFGPDFGPGFGPGPDAPVEPEATEGA